MCKRTYATKNGSTTTMVRLIQLSHSDSLTEYTDEKKKKETQNMDSKHFQSRNKLIQHYPNLLQLQS